MNAPGSGRPPRLRVSSPAGLLAVIPHLLGFTPADSLVVIGTSFEGRVKIAFRYDLPATGGEAAGIAAHAISVLARHDVTAAVAAGYGPGPLVTPAADAIRAAAARAGLDLRDVLRVHDGRYWSYLCTDPDCCPPRGAAFDPAAHPAAAALARAGLPALPGRDALAATIAPLAGPAADAMTQATRRAEHVAARLTARTGPPALDRPGLAAVRATITTYQAGGTIGLPVRHAWLALVLTRLRIRDDAWARMDPAHHGAHRRLWTDLVRRAQPGYIAAPASLLAFTAWQAGDGALANIALERALADVSGYTMALLLQRALDVGAPPSLAVPPMTPDEVTASYADPSPGADAGNAGG